MKVSIIIPYHNGEEYIAKAISSLKAQNYTNFEVILVNNGSTDNSETVAKREVGKDKRFSFIDEPNLGISNALNAGISNSTGECISFLDCDDIYLENRLKDAVREIKSGADLVACRGLKIDMSGNVFGKTPQFFQSSEMIKTVLMHHNIVNSLSYITISKKSLLKAMPLPSNYTWILDYYLMLFASKNEMKIKFINEPLVKRLYHDKNHSLDYAKIMKQVVPLLIDNYKNDDNVKQYITMGNLRDILTKKYIMGVQYLRRHGYLDEIKTYLKDYVDLGYIRNEIYYYFNTMAYYLTDKEKFYDFVKTNGITHPFGNFVRGLYYFELKEFEQAELYFKKIFIDTNQIFPDIMNFCALSQYFFDKEHGINTLKNIIANFPDYQDAYYNLDCIYSNRDNEFKINVFLIPATIDSLLSFAKENKKIF